MDELPLNLFNSKGKEILVINFKTQCSIYNRIMYPGIGVKYVDLSTTLSMLLEKNDNSKTTKNIKHMTNQRKKCEGGNVEEGYGTPNILNYFNLRLALLSIYEVSPEGIQPWVMKNRDIY